MKFFVNMKSYADQHYIAIDCQNGSNFSMLLNCLMESLLVKHSEEKTSVEKDLHSRWQGSAIKQEIASLFCWHVLVSSTSMIPVELFS